MIIKEVGEYYINIHFMPYIINGEMDNLTDQEINLIDIFLYDIGHNLIYVYDAYIDYYEFIKCDICNKYSACYKVTIHKEDKTYKFIPLNKKSKL